MTKSKKRNVRRKKQNAHKQGQRNHALNTEEEKKPIEAKKKYPDQPTRVAPLQKKKIIGLIEETANKLKVENNLKLVVILETVLSVFSGDVEKRPARLQLIDSLLSKVKEYEQSEIKALKSQLNSVFLPKELKELTVDASDLTESFNLLSLFLYGPCEFKSYLNRGRPIRVHIKESEEDDDGDDLKIVREAKILSQLRHENIIRILAFEKTGPRIALEYMKLGPLSEALMEFNFSNKKLCNVVKEVTSGMIYLAERHYILRNLKTENILLDSRGKCKIGNFAYCEYVGDCNGVYIDKETDLDLDFAAPEVRNAKEFSIKSDAWDLGLLVWQVYHVEPDQDLCSSLTCRLNTWALLRLFIESGRLLKPERFPISQWQSFRELLHQDPNARPTFFEIMRIFREID